VSFGASPKEKRGVGVGGGGGDIVNKSQFLMLQDFSFRRKRHSNKMSWMGCVCKLRIFINA